MQKTTEQKHCPSICNGQTRAQTLTTASFFRQSHPLASGHEQFMSRPKNTLKLQSSRDIKKTAQAFPK